MREEYRNNKKILFPKPKIVNIMKSLTWQISNLEQLTKWLSPAGKSLVWTLMGTCLHSPQKQRVVISFKHLNCEFTTKCFRSRTCWRQKIREQKDKKHQNSSLLYQHLRRECCLLFGACPYYCSRHWNFLCENCFLNSSASYSFSDMFGDAIVASDEQTQENAS